MLSLLLSTLVTKTNFTNVNNCILGLVHFAVKDVRSLNPKFTYSYRVNYKREARCAGRPQYYLPKIKMTAHDKPNTLCKVSGPSGDPKRFIDGPASSHLRDEVNHVAFQFRPKYSPRLISIFVIMLLYFSTPDLHHPPRAFEASWLIPPLVYTFLLGF